jgi:hypothetical protein
MPSKRSQNPLKIEAVRKEKGMQPRMLYPFIRNPGISNHLGAYIFIGQFLICLFSVDISMQVVQVHWNIARPAISYMSISSTRRGFDKPEPYGSMIDRNIRLAIPIKVSRYRDIGRSSSVIDSIGGNLLKKG